MKAKLLLLIGVLCVTLIGTVVSGVEATPKNATITYNFNGDLDWSVTVKDPDGISMVSVMCYKNPPETIVLETFKCPGCPTSYTFVIPRVHWNDHDHSIRILDCETTPHSTLWVWPRGQNSPDGPYYPSAGGYSVPIAKKPDSSTPQIVFIAAMIPLTLGVLYAWNRRGRKAFV